MWCMCLLVNECVHDRIVPHTRAMIMALAHLTPSVPAVPKVSTRDVNLPSAAVPFTVDEEVTLASEPAVEWNVVPPANVVRRFAQS